MTEVILHSALNAAKLIPLLYLAYLVMEYIENRMGDKQKSFLRRAGAFGPVIGGVLGLIPQCGFAAAASGLYAGRVITLGTVVAVFLSASDEMLPILISSAVPLRVIVNILLIKAAIGIAAGFAADAVFKSRVSENKISEMCRHEECGCDHGIFVPALRHTIKTVLFIFAATLALDALIHLTGEDALREFASSVPVLGEFVCAALGMIPSCASSVVITELYLEGVISGGAMLSGLLSCSGVGLLVLFKTNKNMKENIAAALFVYVVGALSGVAFNAFGLSF